MAVAISELPRIVEVLSAIDRPLFVILEYDEFVRFVVAASGGLAPDIVSVVDYRGEHAFVVLPWAHYRTYIGLINVLGEINETHYLERHYDVRAAVEQGSLASGTSHYLMQGYFERREVQFPTM